MNYTVMTCFNTMQLYNRFKDDYGLYIPVERVRRTDPKTKAVSIHEYPCMPGFIFCPEGAEDALLRRLPQDLYELKVVRTVEELRPYRVRLEVLHEMQRILNEEFASPLEKSIMQEAKTKAKGIKIGDTVKVVSLVFTDLTGTVVQFKKNDTVRIKTNGSIPFIEVNRRFLQKISEAPK